MLSYHIQGGLYMKKTCSIFLLMAMIISISSIVSIPAYAATSGYLTYTVANEEVTITDCDPEISGDYDIPEYLGGYPVTVIGKEAFMNCNRLDSVTIPDNVRAIEESAFEACTFLTDVALPASLTTIGESAFNSTSVDNITLPDSVVSIGSYAFMWCGNLRNLQLNEGIASIGDDAFYNTYIYKNSDNWENGVLYIDHHLIKAKEDLSGTYTIDVNTLCIADDAFIEATELTALEATRFNSLYSSSNGVLYNKEQTALLHYPTGKRGAFTIPAGVTSIEKYAFRNCSGLSIITIPADVISIGDYAFMDCTNLTSLKLRDAITSIGNDVIEGSAVTDIFYDGFEEELDDITFGAENDQLFNATWHYKFPDVPSSHWAYEAVKYCYYNGIMSGVGDGSTFNPGGTMTRAALVSMLYRLDGSEPVNGTADFTDVAAGAWYADAVAWASQNGIVSGKGDGRFAPTDPVTRASFVSILYRYADYCGEDVTNRADLSEFADAANVPNWAKENIEWAVAEGLLNGVTSGNTIKVNPTGKATRAQGAVLLKKFCDM